MNNVSEGILLIDKPRGLTSFDLVRKLRKRLNIQKIGHSGTLDPFATGVMVMLIGRSYTRLSNLFLSADKEYLAEIRLGISTETCDLEGKVLLQSSYVPTLREIEEALRFFQGEIEQIPPMYSAKKKGGKKLYEFARKGIEVPREPIKVNLKTDFVHYEYPYLKLRIACSKGTYIRVLADDLGKKLESKGHLTSLQRTRSGDFYLADCITESQFNSFSFDLQEKLIRF